MRPRVGGFGASREQTAVTRHGDQKEPTSDQHTVDVPQPGKHPVSITMRAVVQDTGSSFSINDWCTRIAYSIRLGQRESKCRWVLVVSVFLTVADARQTILRRSFKDRSEH